MRIHPFRLIRVVSSCLLFLICIALIYHKYLDKIPTLSNTVNDRFLNSDLADRGYIKPIRIDWENYSLVALENSRVGPGENGMPVKLSTHEKKIAAKTINENGFSVYVSTKIKTDRSIKDIRHPNCKGKLYSNKLPTASVIIPFFEEHWETLLRTVASVLNRAPSALIKEVILVDDGSSREYLKDRLDSHIISAYPDGKVRVIHLKERQGLIRAKTAGAKEATGEVLIFLDSHCEAGINWLPPLLDPIAANYRTVVCPFIDVIDADNFEYRAQDEGARGAFDWELYYKRLPRLPEDNHHPEEPFDSPVMAGGLFAISAKWFWELGGYDPGLVIWGGEQYELSFKIWMCGGRMIDTPCSRIGHIYRKYSTNFPKSQLGDFVGRNYKRVAEVWMDEYKEYLYKRRPSYRHLDPGDLTEQFKIRERLKCKSFKWFMTEVAFDLVKKYPLIEPISVAVGEIRSVSDSSLCLDATDASEYTPVKLRPCDKDNPGVSSVQKFEYNYRQDIRVLNHGTCLDEPGLKNEKTVFLYSCHGQGGNQRWKIQPVNNDKSNPIRLIHGANAGCLEADTKNRVVSVKPCDYGSFTQRWTWEKLQFDLAVKSLKEAGL
uniref:Polypeptide N-acetylgalactosaminyltransferase n=1 Tax=Schistosoma japonicum TaxID=6182 RepID=C1LGK0_SCHJA|nr:polypeptide GalNAc transferase 6 [Schistosoma japonicum]